jgi:Transposase DDE domain group 1
MKDTIDLLVWVYNQRAGAENLIKEANNDAGLAAHPSRQWAANCVHFQLVMLAYNLNCWLLLFNREEKLVVDDLEHSTLVTARLRLLFWRPRSGGTPGEWASVIAIDIRSADCSSG